MFRTSAPLCGAVPEEVYSNLCYWSREVNTGLDPVRESENNIAMANALREVAGRLTEQTDLLEATKYHDVVVSQGLVRQS